MFGWWLNAWLHTTGLDRLPVFGRLWFSGKRMIARWLSSGHGVPVSLGGQPTYIHPFTIAYGIHTWEPYTTELFQNALKPGFTVLDIGAHHGYFSLLAARCVGPEGTVYAFEPAPDNLQILKRNVELNHLTNVIPINKAVSDKCATVPFYFRQRTGVTGSLLAAHQPNESTIAVECVTIDEHLAGKPVDVVKMDIEGGEPHALQGMKKTMSQSKDMVLFVEFNRSCLLQAGVNQQAFLAQLKKADFECQVINEELRCLQPIKPGLESCNLYCLKEAAKHPVNAAC